MCLRRSLSVSIRLCVCVWEQPVCVCLPHPSPFSFILQGLCWIWALIRCRPASQGHTCLDIHPGVPLQTKRPSSVTGQNLDFTCEKRTVVYTCIFFLSSKIFYVITHLIGCSTCRKILHNICIYLKGHTYIYIYVSTYLFLTFSKVVLLSVLFVFALSNIYI